MNPSTPPATSIPATDPVRPRVLRYGLPTLLAAGGLGALELGRSLFQRSRVFAPTRFPHGEWLPRLQGLDAEDTWLETEDGEVLHGWWIPQDGARVTVVYCHGNSGSLGHRVEILKTMHRELGANFFAFDYRGYGRSTGSPSERGVCIDVGAALDHVVKSRGIALSRVVLFGHSLGGAVAIDGARQQPVAGLIAQSTFTRLSDMARHVFQGLPGMHLVARDEPLHSVAKVGELALPKLFLHGTADATIPYRMGEELYAAAATPKAFRAISGAGHNDLHERDPGSYFRYLSRFLRRAVG